MTESIELRQLRYFAALAEELHFGRAARRLGISQPPLTRQIQQLERALGAPLFERTKHVVQLTVAGRVFLEETRKTLEQVSRSFELAQRAHRGELGQLALGVAPLLEASAYPALEAHIRKNFPHVQVKRHVLPSDQQPPLIRNASLHAGLVRLPLEEHDSLTLEFLFREALVVIMRDDHRLANRRAVRIAELSGQNRIAIRKKFNPAFYRYIRLLCDRGEYRAARVIPVNTLPELLNSVLSADGVAIVPASLKRQFTSRLHYARLLDTNADIQVGLVYRRDNPSQIVHLLQRVIHQMEWPNIA
ncbi:MAG TPA: LysR substrate-binding domain-containing protein [Bryobacteraceae bacterium]|jgi:DNA-binding transcriptional LysR family regulator